MQFALALAPLVAPQHYAMVAEHILVVRAVHHEKSRGRATTPLTFHVGYRGSVMYLKIFSAGLSYEQVRVIILLSKRVATKGEHSGICSRWNQGQPNCMQPWLVLHAWTML